MRPDWGIKRLGEVCKTGAGGTPLKREKSYYENGTIPWLLSGEVGKKDILEAQNYISEQGLNNSSAKVFPENSVLIAMYGATAGEVGILRFPAATNQAVCAIFPNDVILPEFLFYFFNHFKNELVAQAVGNAQPNISQTKIRNTQIPIPPLPEQKAIVRILDQAFAAIDQAQANIQRNIENAEELLDSVSQTLFESSIEGDYLWTLNDICELIVDCEHKTAPTQETGYPSIRTPNIGYGELILEDVNRVSEEVYKKWTRRAIPQPGDLILAREAPAGNIAVIPKDTYVCLGQRTVLIRPQRDKLNPKYLAYLILSRNVQKRLLSHSQGATVGHINMRDIRGFKFSELPSLEEQKKMVENIEVTLNKYRLITKTYGMKTQNLENQNHQGHPGTKGSH